MNKLKSGILLAYAILAMSAPAVLAAQPADADNQTAGAALVNMDSRNDKEASKDRSGSDKTSSETDHDTLIPVDSDMLSDADFSVNGIGLDSTVDSVKAKLYNPDSAISRGIYDEYNWKGISVEALKPFLNKYVNRKDLSIGSQIKHTGISKIVITSDSIKTARGVTAGMNRESVLRKYGRPDKVLWEKFDDSFCLVYKKENTGIGPHMMQNIFGVVKAYSTRVGEGPFPTELHDETGEYLRNTAHEFGTVTGRPRRIGWLDTRAVRYAAALNSFDYLAITRLDILDGMEEIKVCTGYEYEGKEVEEYPADLKFLGKITPVYKTFKGWKEKSATSAITMNSRPSAANTSKASPSSSEYQSASYP